MPDFIQQGPGGQQPPQQPGPPNDFLSPVDKSQMAAQAMPAAQPPMAQQGTPQGAGFGATQENPLTAQEEPANEMEQAQYEDLFTRVMSAVNDTRGDPSPADSVIKLMSVKGKQAPEAIGRAVGMIMSQMVDLGKRNGVEYDGRVVQEVGMDLTEELAEIAMESGAISNMPQPESEGWVKLIELSVLEASKFFGEWLLRTGQADRQGHMAEIEEQMQREADSGALDQWGMEELDPQMRDQIAGTLQQQRGGMPNG